MTRVERVARELGSRYGYLEWDLIAPLGRNRLTIAAEHAIAAVDAADAAIREEKKR